MIKFVNFNPNNSRIIPLSDSDLGKLKFLKKFKFT